MLLARRPPQIHISGSSCLQSKQVWHSKQVSIWGYNCSNVPNLMGVYRIASLTWRWCVVVLPLNFPKNNLNAFQLHFKWWDGCQSALTELSSCWYFSVFSMERGDLCKRVRQGDSWRVSLFGFDEKYSAASEGAPATVEVFIIILGCVRMWVLNCISTHLESLGELILLLDINSWKHLCFMLQPLQEMKWAVVIVGGVGGMVVAEWGIRLPSTAQAQPGHQMPIHIVIT